LKFKAEDAYVFALKWLHDDYAPIVLAGSIRQIDKRKVIKAINDVLRIGDTFIFALSDENGKVIRQFYERITAFIFYHWDGTFTLRRSLINALCNFYNTGFVLLRCSLDMLFQGLLFQCLSMKHFRESEELKEIKKDSKLQRMVDQLMKLLDENPNEADRLEKNSAHIFDLFERIPSLPPEIRQTYDLLAKWGFFHPIKKSIKVIDRLYYAELSYNVHQNFRAIDIGRAVLEGEEIFEVHCPFLKKSLEDYLKAFHEVSDLWMLSELNLLKFTLPPEFLEKKLKDFGTIS
jgi:hypothetical protein